MHLTSDLSLVIPEVEAKIQAEVANRGPRAKQEERANDRFKKSIPWPDRRGARSGRSSGAFGQRAGNQPSQQRQAGRDVNQAAKHDARSTKVDCRAANQQSNAACRHDKRGTRQEGRQDKRDIKY